MKTSIVIFADGACSGNPGPGGWGTIILYPSGEVVELGGASKETTNNRMEITAVGKAMRELEKTPGDLDIYTDSKYVIDGFMKWLQGWRNNGWKKSDGKPISNLEFWKRLDLLATERQEKYGSKIHFHYVKGHSGHPANDRCDEIAVAYSKGKSVDLYRGPVVAYGFDLSVR